MNNNAINCTLSATILMMMAEFMPAEIKGEPRGESCVICLTGPAPLLHMKGGMGPASTGHFGTKFQ